MVKNCNHPPSSCPSHCATKPYWSQWPIYNQYMRTVGRAGKTAFLSLFWQSCFPSYNDYAGSSPNVGSLCFLCVCMHSTVLWILNLLIHRIFRQVHFRPFLVVLNLSCCCPPSLRQTFSASVMKRKKHSSCPLRISHLNYRFLGLPNVQVSVNEVAIILIIILQVLKLWTHFNTETCYVNNVVYGLQIKQWF